MLRGSSSARIWTRSLTPARSTAFSAWCWESRWSRIAAGRRLAVEIEVIGFSEEEGVRFGVRFIGSRALVGTIDDGLLAAHYVPAIRDFGLDPAAIPAAAWRQ